MTLILMTLITITLHLQVASTKPIHVVVTTYDRRTGEPGQGARSKMKVVTVTLEPVRPALS